MISGVTETCGIVLSVEVLLNTGHSLRTIAGIFRDIEILTLDQGFLILYVDSVS